MNKLGLRQVIVGILYLALGIMTLSRPVGSTSVYLMVFSSIIIVYTVYELVFIIKENSSRLRMRVANSLLVILICTLIIISPYTALEVIGYVLGTFVIISSIYRLISHYKKHNNLSILSVVMIVIGLVIILDPVTIAGYAASFVAISLILIGGIKILIGFAVNKFTGSSFQMFSGQQAEEKVIEKDNEFIDVDYKDVD